MIRHIVLTSVTVIGLTAAASAADMYVPAAAGPGYKDVDVPVASWTGFYAGINGGGAFDDNSGKITFSNSVAQVFTLAKSLDASGGFGGGQIGYNWQGVWHPQLVLGVEADIQSADIKGSFSGSTVSGGFNDVWAGHTEIDWFGTVRGRIGYSFGQALLYGTGGLAFGEVKHSFVRTVGAGAASDSDDSTRAGWTAGGGVEYQFSPAWSAKVEYQFIDLGSTTATGTDTAPVTASTNHLDNSFSTVRAGVNYHVGSIYEPLK